MAKTVDQIRLQIAKLQEREKALLQKEAVGVIARIKEAVAHYGLSAEQIFGSNGESKPAAKAAVSGGVPAKKTPGVRNTAAKSPKARGVRAGRVLQAGSDAIDAAPSRAPSPAKGKKVAAKFKDDAGNTWSGRGSQPRWVRAAVEAGKTLEEFLVA